jgi:MFS family permease
VLLYPLYALLFADAGLTTGQISTLFALWSVVSFAAEIPSGALADTWSRRRLYALGAFGTAAGFAAWTLWPAYPGFALGFVLWGLGGALASGALEALVYDELAAAGQEHRYARVAGRAGTVAILSMLLATLLASPAYLWGGYPLVGALSVVVAAAAGVLALGLPETPRQPAGGDAAGGYLGTLRAGLRRARSGRVAWIVAIAALVPGLSALDEYLPLISRATGVPTAVAPLLFALPALAMALGSALAGWGAAIRPAGLALVLAVAAALLTAGGLSGHAAGMLPIGAAFGLLQFAMVVTEARLQEAVPSRVRATVLSVSGFAAEVVAVALYAFFGLGAAVAAVPVLFGLTGLPVLATALAVALRLPGAGTQRGQRAAANDTIAGSPGE